jgi:hypothetical protein
MDLYLDWNGDFQVSATGGLLFVSGDQQTQQRLIRRLMTAVNGYVFHPSYGAGLPQRIGRPGRVASIKAIVKSQLTLEATVDPTKPMNVTVTQPNPGTGLFVIVVTYTTRSGSQVSLSFDTGS